MQGFFVTGTDTNIGKTIVSAWLCAHTNADYWKPIQSGTDEGTDNNIISSLSPTSFIHPNCYTFKAPLSPHLAAKLENKTIDFLTLKDQIPKTNNLLIVEGAGGVLVPLAKDLLMIDLIKTLNIPVLIVMSTKLGTINHTCLTIEALKTRKITIAGIIINDMPNLDIIATIEEYTGIKILACCQQFSPLTNETIKQHPLPNKLINDLTTEIPTSFSINNKPINNHNESQNENF